MNQLHTLAGNIFDTDINNLKDELRRVCAESTGLSCAIQTSMLELQTLCRARRGIDTHADNLVKRIITLEHKKFALANNHIDTQEREIA